MKKLVVTGDSDIMSPLNAYDEKYLAGASCPVKAEYESGKITFIWDDSLRQSDGTLTETLCPRPVDRVLDTLDDILGGIFENYTNEQYNEFRNRIREMRPGETLEFDSRLDIFRENEDSDEPLKPKFSVGDVLYKAGYCEHTVKSIYNNETYVCEIDDDGPAESHISVSEQGDWTFVRNIYAASATINPTTFWRVLKSHRPCAEAIADLQKGEIDGKAVAIRHLTRKIITRENMTENFLSPQDVMSNEWEVLVQDVQIQERIERLNEIRTLLKRTNYLGIKHDVIDNMSLEDMWTKMSQHRFSEEKIYSIMKFILKDLQGK